MDNAEDFLYLEADGMVYLVLDEASGHLTFPRRRDVTIPHEVRGTMHFPQGDVQVGIPHLDTHPSDWVFKDDVPARDDVTIIVRRAINGSLTREVTGALLFHPNDERILLVMASRGFTKGTWNIPGGFLTWGETPEEGLVREVEEETGLPLKLTRLLGVYTQRFGSPYYMRGHFYAARALSTDLNLQADEIGDARWFSLDEARDVMLNPFGVRALEDLTAGRGMAL